MHAPVRSLRFEDVFVWQKAHRLALDVYRFSGRFPRTETFGLTIQLRRAVVSVPANFAEGFKKRSRADKARLYNIAQGSLEECRYYLTLAEDLGYGNSRTLRQQAEEVGRLLETYSQRMLANASDK